MRCATEAIRHIVTFSVRVYPNPNPQSTQPAGRALVVRPKNLSGLLASRLIGPSALRLLTLTAARTSPSLASGATSTGMLALMLTYSTRRESCAHVPWRNDNRIEISRLCSLDVS